jgi:dUTPase
MLVSFPGQNGLRHLLPFGRGAHAVRHTFMSKQGMSSKISDGMNYNQRMRCTSISRVELIFIDAIGCVEADEERHIRGIKVPTTRVAAS